MPDTIKEISSVARLPIPQGQGAARESCIITPCVSASGVSIHTRACVDKPVQDLPGYCLVVAVDWLNRNNGLNLGLLGSELPSLRPIWSQGCFCMMPTLVAKPYPS